jgi:hypothetical protein
MGDISKGVADTLQPAKKIYKKNVNVHNLPLLQDSVKLTVHLLDLPDQVNTDLVKEGDKLDLQVNTKNTDLVEEGDKLDQQV